MSFILDALKKSESDRQRQSGPSLFEVKVAPPRRALPVWAVAIAVLLAVNIVVISWMLLRRPAAPQQPPTAVAPPPVTVTDSLLAGRSADISSTAVNTVPAAGTAAQPPGATLGRPAGSAAPPPSLSVVPPVAPGAPVTSQPGAAPPAAAPPTAVPPAEGGPDQSGAESAGQAGPGSDSSDYAPAVEPSGGHGGRGAAAGQSDTLPLYQQIVGSAGLPTLHLDLHVFASRPQDRFAMINMQRVGEGDSLPGGVQVEAIRPDGVVLSYHGTRFLLPRD